MSNVALKMILNRHLLLCLYVFLFIITVLLLKLHRATMPTCMLPSFGLTALYAR